MNLVFLPLAIWVERGINFFNDFFGAVGTRDINPRPGEPMGVLDDIRIGVARKQQAFNMARRISNGGCIR